MMADWSSEAREYLDGYLKQVSVLVRKQGDDPKDVVAALRDHVLNEAESEGLETVTIEWLLPVLSNLGMPEEVASLDPLTLASTTASKPRSPAKRSALSGGSWACCAVAAIVSGIAVLVLVAATIFMFASYKRSASFDPDGGNALIHQESGAVVR